MSHKVFIYDEMAKINIQRYHASGETALSIHPNNLRESGD